MKNQNLSEMSQEAREAKNRYAREYRRKNRDKIQEYQRRYWEKKAKECQ